MATHYHGTGKFFWLIAITGTQGDCAGEVIFLVSLPNIGHMICLGMVTLAQPTYGEIMPNRVTHGSVCASVSVPKGWGLMVG